MSSARARADRLDSDAIRREAVPVMRARVFSHNAGPRIRKISDMPRTMPRSFNRPILDPSQGLVMLISRRRKVLFAITRHSVPTEQEPQSSRGSCAIRIPAR